VRVQFIKPPDQGVGYAEPFPPFSACRGQHLAGQVFDISPLTGFFWIFYKTFCYKYSTANAVRVSDVKFVMFIAEMLYSRRIRIFTQRRRNAEVRKEALHVSLRFRLEMSRDMFFGVPACQGFTT